MSTASTIAIRPRRELAFRAGGGIEVTLYWDAADDSTSVEIYHLATEETIEFTVPREHALDAFHHPFAHLPRQSTDFEAADLELINHEKGTQ